MFATVSRDILSARMLAGARYRAAGRSRTPRAHDRELCSGDACWLAVPKTRVPTRASARSLSWHFLALDVAFADLRALGAARRGAITLTTPCASDERVRAGPPTALRFA